MRTAVTRLSRSIAARRALVDGRREHDHAMAIPKVATEHVTQVLRARERGEHGCRYCP